MKIRRKLLSSFIGTCLLIGGFTGFILKTTDESIKYNVKELNENLIFEAKNSKDITLSLQMVHSSVLEIMTERYKLLVEPNKHKAQQEIELTQQIITKQKNIIETQINSEINKKNNLLAFSKSNNFKQLEDPQQIERELNALNKLKLKYFKYKQLVERYLSLSLTEASKTDEFLEKTLKPYFDQEIFPLLQEYEANTQIAITGKSKEIQKDITKANKLITISLLFSLFVASYLAFLISNSISQPIIQLKNTATKIGRGQLNFKININSNDELGILASTFNQMIEDLSSTTVAKSYLDNIINSMIDSLIVLDKNALIIRVNQATVNLLGYEEHELVGKPLARILSETYDDELLNTNGLLQQGLIGNLERSYLKKDGSNIAVSFSSSVMRDDCGKIQGIVCVAQDITARKQAEKNLENSLFLLRATLESTADGILVVDTAGKIQSFNQKFIEMWDIPDEILNSREHNQAIAFILHQLKDPEGFLRRIRELDIESDVHSCDLIELKDGRRVERYSQPQLIARKSVGRVWSYSDITKRKQAEERLAKINECLLSAGADPNENINRLTALCGELLGATCTIYSRLNKGRLRLVGQWNVPVGYNLVDGTDGHICYDTIQQGDRKPFVVNNLPSTAYAQTDPNVIMYGLKTCIGQTVKCKDSIGSLCAVYQKDFITSDADLTVIGIIATAIAVEEERRWTQEALRISEERYALSARGANDGLWDWNLLTDEFYFSQRWKSMLGYEENEIGNSPEEWFKWIHPDDIEKVKAAIAAHLEGLSPHLETEYRMLHQDGKYRWILCRGLFVRDVDNLLYRIAGSQTDVTQRKQDEAQLLHQAWYDALTGLSNRVLFRERLGLAIERAKREENYLFAVLFLDLDRFKVVNDSLGHLVGDQLLKAIARRLEVCVRPEDTVARLGGDEFTILVENIIDVADATQIAERIQQEITSPFNLSGHEIFIGVSIGIALSTQGYNKPEDLLRDADVTMYRAKALGKGRSEVFDPTVHNQAMARLQLETDLRQALNRQEFQLYYQPIMSLKSGNISGFEALLRWQHPTLGMVSPAEFIPLAEETGLIVPIGWWVLGEACRQMRTWQLKFPTKPPLTISVNLSAKQFLQPNLIEQIKQTLADTGLDAHQLGLEITESAVMENAESANDMLMQLRTLGVQLFIDDFGTGYSSLSYLHRFPFNTLKIDRSFVSRMGVDGENSEIVRTIVTLAKSLDMDVTAEGVETQTQLNQLRALKCEHGQGYFFSRPLDCTAAESLIAAQRQSRSNLQLTLV